MSSERWRSAPTCWRSAALVTALVVAMSACGGSAGAPAVSSPATAATASSPPPSPAASPHTAHVFVVVMENRSYAQAMAEPYTAGLAAKYGVATNYHAVAHPSLPNYLALTGGSTFGITDDGYHRLPAGGVGAQLTERGVAWRAYMEGMVRGCFDSPSPYALKHNPFAYFGGACPGNVVPLTALAGDLAATTPNVVWITPDLCHDGHDCSTKQADDFLAGLIPRILASDAWRQDGVLLITWDEDDGGSGNRVPAIVAAPGLAHRVSDRRHDHYSLLATVEDRLGLQRLGQAASADPLTELLG
jgi:hypothetical protein